MGFMMSTNKTLQQIDQAIIELVCDRITVLAQGAPSPLQEQVRSHQALLAQMGVPETLWEGIVVGSMAALAQAPMDQPPQGTARRRVTVVGGGGVMGQFFTTQLLATGHEVKILEYDAWDNAAALLSGAELVLVCVPLKSTVGVIRNLARYLSPTTVLADIASVKVPMVEAMLEAHAGPVLGLHPMFGPGVKSLLAQKVVVCSGRAPEAGQWFLDWIEQNGGELIHCTPQEHDHMMVTVQAIRHFLTLSLGVFLVEEGIDVRRSLDFASPIYRMELNRISRLFAQDGSLSADIMLASEERPQAIARLVNTCSRLIELLIRGDRSAIISEFESAQAAYRDEAHRALSESNYLINTLSSFLAAHQ
jgi:prephenate dehydrogenase/chorismate mutase/prephenate dehydrogenase